MHVFSGRLPRALGEREILKGEMEEQHRGSDLFLWKTIFLPAVLRDAIPCHSTPCLKAAPSSPSL